MNNQLPEELITPHVPLGLMLDEGISILESTGNEVGSVWYDDSTGRESTWGIEKKIEMYLERYGLLSNWELRMENGWMRYWFNPNDHASMVYGIHNDVIRFNQYDGENG